MWDDAFVGRFVGGASRGPAKQEERITNCLSLVRQEALSTEESKGRARLIRAYRANLEPLLTPIERGALFAANEAKERSQITLGAMGQTIKSGIFGTTAKKLAIAVGAFILPARLLKSYSTAECMKECGAVHCAAHTALIQVVSSLLVLLIQSTGVTILTHALYTLLKAFRRNLKHAKERTTTVDQARNRREELADPEERGSMAA